MYVSSYYLFIILPALILSICAQIGVKSQYRKYSQIENSRRLTGAQAAMEVLRLNGVTGVAVDMIGGELSDCYDPRTNTIHLSAGVYNSCSIAAVGIACHEAGHACQYACGYFPIRLRKAVIPVANIGTSIGIPLCLLGFIFQDSMGILFYIGLILYSMVFVFQLVTLPVEFNASARAIKVIKSNGLLDAQESVGATRVLKAAAMTYVAAMAASAANIIRLLLLFRSNNRR